MDQNGPFRCLYNLSAYSIHTNYQWKLYLHYIVEKVRPIKLRLYYGKILAKINAEWVPILSFIENESSA